MTPEHANECLQFALETVRASSPIALQYFRRPMAVEDKQSGGYYDPVTETDKGVETFLRERLLERYPTFGLLGEEHGSTGPRDTYWVIDPIDGTRAFISGMPCWGTLLGLVDDGRSVAGIMHQPFTGETYAANLERSWLTHNGAVRELRTRADACLADAILYSTHPDMFTDAEFARRYAVLSRKCRLQRWGGDCYAYALLSLGCIDLVVEANLQAYDIVPLIPIIERAGGIVTDLEGRSPMMGGTVVASANRALHSEAIACLTGRGD